MTKRLMLLLLLISGFYTFNSYAVAKWYKGKITRITLYATNESFIITFDNNTLDDCRWKYGYFDVNKLGVEKVKSAYSMAMLAFSSGKTFGIVIDKDLLVNDDRCFAQGMAADIVLD